MVIETIALSVIFFLGNSTQCLREKSNRCLNYKVLNFGKHNTLEMNFKNPGYLSQRYDEVFEEIIHMSITEKEFQNI